MGLLDRHKIIFVGILFLAFILIFMPSLGHVRHMQLIVDHSKKEANIGAQVNAQEELNASTERTPQPKGELQTVLEQGGSGRANFWKKAIVIFCSSPIYGTGLNTYGRILKRDPDQRTWWYAHNCYLQLAAETGILGLAAFLWAVFVLLRQGLIFCTQIKDIWALPILQGAVSGLVAYLVQSFFDNTFYTVQLATLMWLIFGLMVAVMRRSRY